MIETANMWGLAATHSEALATGVSALVAILLGVYGYRINRRRHRREYTLNVIAPLLTNERLFCAHCIIMAHAIDERKLDPTGLSDDERSLILQLLSYYEFLAASFFRKAVDRSTVLRQRKRSIHQTFCVAEPLIKERRDALGYDTAYIEIERLATKHCR